MQILKDIMTLDVEVITPHATIQEAALMMKDLNVGAIPVCDGDKLFGMVTDRDLVIRVLAEGRNPKAVPVSKAMSSGVVYCFEDEDIEKAFHLMAQRQIRRLPILSRANTLVGIVTLGDLAVYGENPQRTSHVLEQVSAPAHPNRGLSER